MLRALALFPLISSAFLLRSVGILARLSVFAEACSIESSAMAIAMARKDEVPHLQDVNNVPARLSIVVGENLRNLRRKHNLSLEQLAHISGVSRAMLGQIETGKSAPTINLLGRIAEALKVSVASLISTPGNAGTIIVPHDKATVVAFSEGQFVCRALFPWGDRQKVEIYEVAIGANHEETCAALPAGTKKSIVVVTGELEVAVGDDSPAHLSGGDAILFSADTRHHLRNPRDQETKAFLVVMSFEDAGTRGRPT